MIKRGKKEKEKKSSIMLLSAMCWFLAFEGISFIKVDMAKHPISYKVPVLIPLLLF